MITSTRFISLVLLLAACKPQENDDHHGHEIPECVEYDLDTCTPLYPATFDEVWNQTLSDTCAEFGDACHAQEGAEGAVHGLVFADPQMAWDHMTGADEPVVVPGDALCSHLFVRIASEDPEIRMPPGGSGLSPAAVCSIGQWIESGATYVEP